MNTCRSRLNRISIILGARHNFWLDHRVQRTVDALSQEGYEIYVYTPSESKDQEQYVDDIEVRYVRTPLGDNKLARKLLLDYLLYNIPSALRIRQDKVNIVHCNDFDTLLSGVLVKILSLSKVKLVYDSHEDYSLFVQQGHSRFLSIVIGIAERILACLFVNLVIATTETVRNKFQKKGLTSISILNCQDLIDWSLYDDNTVIGKKQGEFWITYQGKPTKIRGYEKMIEAANILINIRKIKGLRFIVIGGSESDKSYLESLELLVQNYSLQSQFRFTRHIKYIDMMQILRHSDVGLILFQPTPMNKAGLPNKLFENLVAGIPTISCDFPEIANIINREKCGLLIDSSKPEEIADAIEYLFEDEAIKLEMGRNALQAAQERYNFADQANKLKAAYKDIYCIDTTSKIDGKTK
jgi:glycosyltransferase involved in cell wall biosynthesis